MNKFLDHFLDNIQIELCDKFNYKNINELPSFDSILIYIPKNSNVSLKKFLIFTKLFVKIFNLQGSESFKVSKKKSQAKKDFAGFQFILKNKLEVFRFLLFLFKLKKMGFMSLVENEKGSFFVFKLNDNFSNFFGLNYLDKDFKSFNNLSFTIFVKSKNKQNLRKKDFRFLFSKFL
jgi:hypothetical protein